MYFKVFSFYNTQGKEKKGGRERRIEKQKKNCFNLSILFTI